MNFILDENWTDWEIIRKERIKKEKYKFYYGDYNYESTVCT